MLDFIAQTTQPSPDVWLPRIREIGDVLLYVVLGVLGWWYANRVRKSAVDEAVARAYREGRAARIAAETPDPPK